MFAMTKQSNIFTGHLGLPLLEENHQFRRYSKNSHFDCMHLHWPWLWRYTAGHDDDDVGLHDDDDDDDDCFYIALFSTLEQTHCARMWFYMSDYLFIAHFFNIHWCGVLTALAWLVPHETAAVSAQVLRTPYNHATSWKATYVRCMRVLAVTCLRCNLPPALLAEWLGSFTCYCGNMGVEQILK